MLVSKELIHKYNATHGLLRATIYRIERKKDADRGSYGHTHQGPFSDHRFTHLTSMTGIHPTPCEEGIAHSSSGYLVGCKRPADLLEWFSWWNIKDLYKEGFQLAVYEVEAAKHGRIQSVFFRDGIISVERYECPEAACDLIQDDLWSQYSDDDEYLERKKARRTARRARKAEIKENQNELASAN